MSETHSGQIEHLCEVMHDAYEKAAAGNGWETQQASRKPWADVPEANKATMRAAVAALLDDLRVGAQGRVETSIEGTREFRAGMAFGVPEDARGHFLAGISRAAVDALVAS